MNPRQRAALADRYQSDGMSGSSPQKLLLAIFDRLGRDLNTAIEAINANNIELAHRSLVNAQELVFELNFALDPDVWPPALELRSLYSHLLTLLIDANTNKSVETIEQCLDIVNPLAESWREAHRALNEQKVGAGTRVPTGTSAGGAASGSGFLGGTV